MEALARFPSTAVIYCTVNGLNFNISRSVYLLLFGFVPCIADGSMFFYENLFSCVKDPAAHIPTAFLVTVLIVN